jgi:hypothetical protein
MTPQPTTAPRALAPHPQRPWRRVESESRRPARAAPRTFSAPVVRELPPRVAQPEAGAAW